MKILVLNGGSSSLKASLHELGAATSAVQPPLWEAHAEWGREAGHASIRIRAGGAHNDASLSIQSHQDVLRPTIEALWSGPARVIGGPGAIDAVGHRIVHGGKAFVETTRVTAEVRAAIARQAELAPEHNRLELEAIEAAERVVGAAAPQIAVFDTQFHTSMPEEATVYAAPFAWYEEGIRRYGFHGISHQYVSRRAAEMLGNMDLRLVTCHLGNGASLAAVRAGRSIDTTMGFTPLEGLVMGTRSGSIDPGILIYLMRHCRYSADDLDRLLNREAGLQGISGISSDMREVLAAAEGGNVRARLAFDVYIHRLCRETGGMAASLNGIDALVFTAGVGENSAAVRAAACERLGFLGIKLSAAANEQAAPDCDIAAPESRARVLVIRTEEDWEIACECARLLGA